MSKVTAPCGHPGEVVIGTYIRCVMGCEGAKETTRRAQPGHVVNCACKPCQVRQRTTHILLKTKDGKELKVEWDGVTEKVNWTAPWTGTLRHYKFLDKDGAIIATGFLDVPVSSGDPMYLHPQLIADKVQMSVQAAPFHSPFIKEMLEYRPYTDYASLSWYDRYEEFSKEKYDGWVSALTYSLKDLPAPKEDYRTAYANLKYQALDMTVPSRAGKTLRQAAKMQNFTMGSTWGYGERPSPIVNGTAPEIERAALSIPGVKSVRVIAPYALTVVVEILDTDCASPADEHTTADLVQKLLTKEGVAGITYRVSLKTPIQTLRNICKTAEHTVSSVWMSDHVVPGLFKAEIQKRLRELPGCRLTSIEDNLKIKAGYIANFEYKDGVHTRHFRFPLSY